MHKKFNNSQNVQKREIEEKEKKKRMNLQVSYLSYFIPKENLTASVLWQNLCRISIYLHTERIYFKLIYSHINKSEKYHPVIKYFT